MKQKIKKFLPSPLKPLLRFCVSKITDIKFKLRYGFSPPPKGTDLVGYELLIDEIQKHNILHLEGDFVEIGSFIGGGTYKLSKYLSRKKSQKKVYVVDIFNINTDNTKNSSGQVMSEIYANILKGRDQWEVFCELTRGCHNIVVIKGDSKKILLPTKKIAFAFIDGNHEPSYVMNDFYLIWPKLSVNGIVALDDYGYDLPMVTNIVDELIKKHFQEIKSYWVKGKILFVKKGARN